MSACGLCGLCGLSPISTTIHVTRARLRYYKRKVRKLRKLPQWPLLVASVNARPRVHVCGRPHAREAAKCPTRRPVRLQKQASAALLRQGN